MSYTLNLLKDKKVVIVGGSSGIGFAVAEGALAHGAQVIVSSSSEKRVSDAVSSLRSKSPSYIVSGSAVDVKDYDKLRAFLDSVGQFHHLVWTATESPALKAGFPNVDIPSSKDFFEVRYWCTIIAAQHIKLNNLILPGGSITMTIGSVFSRPVPTLTLVSGAAGATESSTRALALDLKPIRVNTISPGVVDTPLWAGFPIAMKEGMFKHVIETLPVGHVAMPEEVAEAYLFAMKCTNLTGQVINVEGGHLIV